jgi:HTH-type transcriptional regulator / antitoxin HigA
MSDIKPIRTEKDYEAAMAEVETLWGAKSGTPKGDRLDVLATLIESWEASNYPMDLPDPIEAIKFRLEQQGLTRKDLEGIIGTRTRIIEQHQRVVAPRELTTCRPNAKANRRRRSKDSAETL